MNDLDRPILFIGTHRSGTTWMGSVFALHPRLAYWPEPRHVWSWGNAYKPDDRLTERDASPRIIRHIRSTFDRFVHANGKDRLVEKTPSNCLRIPFLRAVYPHARIILVVRDGRSVFRSARQIMNTGVPTRRVLQRALETPLWEWPAYASRAASTLARSAVGKPLRYWGPRPPGWRDWVRSDHPDVVRAKQWAATISCALDDARHQPPDRFFQFRYEDLVADPRTVMQRIVDFADLPDADHLVDAVARSADPHRQRKWRDEIDPETLDRIRPHLEPVLNRLGYQW